MGKPKARPVWGGTLFGGGFRLFGGGGFCLGLFGELRAAMPNKHCGCVGIDGHGFANFGMNAADKAGCFDDDFLHVGYSKSGGG